MAVFNMKPGGGPQMGPGPYMDGGPVKGERRASYSQIAAQSQRPPVQQKPRITPMLGPPVQAGGKYAGGLPDYQTQPIGPSVQAYNQGAPAVMPPQMQGAMLNMQGVPGDIGAAANLNRPPESALVNAARRSKPGGYLSPPVPGDIGAAANLNNRPRLANAMQQFRDQFGARNQYGGGSIAPQNITRMLGY